MQRFMQRALELALKAKGQTSPNPMVGAVIVRGGKIIAEGFHKKAGTDHAEIVALKKLRGKNTKRATLYVTMEPCSIHGKTPPCVPAIVEAGIEKVVVGARDPNPKVNGRGIRWLKKKGVEVVEGVLGEECAAMNRPFQKWITTGLPYVTVKVAMSADAKIAGGNGKSKWITNALSRKYVHQLRSEVDAVLIGAGTLRADDPRLTVRRGRSKNGKQPMAVVAGSSNGVSRKARIFRAKNREVFFASNGGGRVDLKSLLKTLARKNVTHLLVEGGGKIFSSFIGRGLADRLVVCMAPKFLGEKALSWLSELPPETMKKRLAMKNVSLSVLDNDVLIEGEFRKGS